MVSKAAVSHMCCSQFGRVLVLKNIPQLEFAWCLQDWTARFGGDVRVKVPSYYIRGTQCLHYLCGDVTVIAWKCWLHLSTAKLFYCFHSSCSLEIGLQAQPTFLTRKSNCLKHSFVKTCLFSTILSIHPPTETTSGSKGWPWTCYI